ncbi:MAG: PASTA domain-containing protein [Chitinispirillia bacterium]|nr:PASTA domain-containing protein [Chitinispirillia bacterium]MCL2268914.1 PASTA domain-containing protein [Chitinispirillia bacterium]
MSKTGKVKDRNYTISMPKRTFWRVFLPLCMFLFTAGGLTAYFVVERIVMPKIVGVQRDLVKTPDVLGKAHEDARNAFFGVGLLTEVRGREFNEEVADGSVISQFPEPGEMVKKGRKIAVTLSRGPEAATVPSVRGMNERQARNEMSRGGFTVGNVRRAWSESQPLDAVIETFPQAGTITSRAMNVDLVISRGPRPTHAEMPNIIGESLSEARKKVEAAGLRVGKVDYRNNPSVVPGTVLSQSAAPGAKVPLESAVDITISAIR